MRIIPRRIEVKKIQDSLPWVVIYGRRKTGKSFIAENFINYDKYFFVNRDGTVLDKKTYEQYTYQEFIKLLREIIGQQKIVIDEFHRLPENFLDFLHGFGIKGQLILITSTMWLAKKLLKNNSPLLGLIKPVKIGLIDERDILIELSKEFKGKDLIENCVYLREVILIPFFKGNIRDFLSSYLVEGKLIIKGLMSEIFTEEEKELTKVYEGVMKAIASGKNTSTEISTYLYSRNLILKDNPGIVQKYLNILCDIGILERIKIYEKKKYKYFHVSPLIDLHYYLEEKYCYTEIDTPKEYIKNVINEKLPLHVKQFIRNLLSKFYGLQIQKIEHKNLEIDIALFKYKKLKIIGEVEWKNYLSKSMIEKIEEKLNNFKNCKKLLIVPSENVLEKYPEDIDVWDVNRLLKEMKSVYNLY